MGNAESVPVVSQLMSAGQAIAGDHEGARRTQERFSRECVGVSQVRSLVEVSMGNSDAALRTQMDFAANADNFADATPGVGHAKAAIHDHCGNHGAAQKAWQMANSVGFVRAKRSKLSFQSSCLIRSRPGWIRFEDMDADMGQNATSLYANDLAGCMQLAETRGYGGFAIWNDVAFFRSTDGAQLRTRLHPRAAVTFFVFDANAALQQGIELGGGSLAVRQEASPVRNATTLPGSNAAQQQGIEFGGGSLAARPRSASAPATHPGSNEHREDPLNIRFTHDEIADRFQPVGNEPAQTLDSVIDAIQRGDASFDDFPPLIVVNYQDTLYSLSNRRLFVARVLAMQGAISAVRVRLERMESDLVQQQSFDDRLRRQSSWWERAFSTRNEGRMVRVRGRGSTFAHIQWRLGHESVGLAGVSRTGGRQRARIARAMHRNQQLSPERRAGLL